MFYVMLLMRMVYWVVILGGGDFHGDSGGFRVSGVGSGSVVVSLSSGG